MFGIRSAFGEQIELLGDTLVIDLGLRSESLSDLGLGEALHVVQEPLRLSDRSARDHVVDLLEDR